MRPITVDRFDEFFYALYGHPPYPWQRRLVHSAVDGRWPGAIDLPTGSGKTAAIDAAIFALAAQAGLSPDERSAPRRVFFTVNRRVIVDEAYERALHIAKSLSTAEGEEDTVLADVANALRIVAASVGDRRRPPLDVLELRGGVYRDNRWARSAIQPTVICTTLDQLGSRLLFRGYGVSPNSAPVQAALVAYDSIIFLDEAHISEPFRQTVTSAQMYLDHSRWSEAPIGVKPMVFVPMTATPTNEMKQAGLLSLDKDDLSVPGLEKRLSASKPAELREVPHLPTGIAEAAVAAVAGPPKAVGVIVNRVATAKQVYETLKKSKPGIPIELVIGSMRPIDRDEQTARLRPLIGKERPSKTERSSFVVATQCLEVGADYDFDFLVTECASVDALKQRFGRLNRAGRPLEAADRAVILMEKRAVLSEQKIQKKVASSGSTSKDFDPVYGAALPRTWNWLQQHAEPVAVGKKGTRKVIDFGIENMGRFMERDNGRQADLLAPSALANAPVMMPAYLDLWCQTSPQPDPDPDVGLFIHGQNQNRADVWVCWRADIEAKTETGDSEWIDIVSMTPPSTAECMSVPYYRMVHWLQNQPAKQDVTSDSLSEPAVEDAISQAPKESALRTSVIVWRGRQESFVLHSTDQLRAGDTVVVPAAAAGAEELGHVPAGVHIDTDETSLFGNETLDRTDDAFMVSREKPMLRLHPTLRSIYPAGAAVDTLFSVARSASEAALTADQWRELLFEAAEEVDGESTPAFAKRLFALAETSFTQEPYPDGRGVVLIGKKRLRQGAYWHVPPVDEGEDETSATEGGPVKLDDHTRHVRNMVRRNLDVLPLNGAVTAEVFLRAAELHDIGKADERFQALLRRVDRTDAWLLLGAQVSVLAKSEGMPTSSFEYRRARERAGLPKGFRHELLSMQLVESRLKDDEEPEEDLLLHLIATHHGRARPMAPVVFDNELPPLVSVTGEMSHEERRQLIPPHRLDSGVVDRYWRLARRFGWWGIAYLEAVLRLADMEASAMEEQGLLG